MRLPIEGKEGWFKNVDTGSVDCSNKRGYEAYMSQYQLEQKEKEKMQALQNDVSVLKSDMSEIKSLLLTLANKNND